MPKLSPLEIARLLASSSNGHILSSRDPSRSVTIFEVPLILDSICENLQLEDLHSCRGVCKTWRVIFEHYRWRTIDWFVAMEENLDGVIRNAHWIRDLKVGPIHTALVGDNRATNLRSLYIKKCCNWGGISRWRFQWDGGYSEDTSEEEDDDDGNRMTPTISTLDLIKQNSRLENLIIDCMRGTSIEHFGSHHLSDYMNSQLERDDSVLFALKRHSSLKFIQLNLMSTNANPKDLAIILKHCPTTTMRQLIIRRRSFFTATGEELELYHSDSAAERYQETWPIFTALQRLKFDGTMEGAEGLVLIPLLRSCPNLVHLTVPAVDRRRNRLLFDTIAKYCPKLEVINMYDNNIFEPDLAHLLQSPLRLRELYLNFPTGFSDLDFLTILRQYSSTLEILHIGFAKISSKAVAQVLEECPHLRKIWIYVSASKNGITLPDLVHTPWASCQIETLSLEVISDASTLGEQDADNKQEIADMIVQLSLKFEQQTNAQPSRSSGLMWRSPEHIMHREYGLSLMKGEITERRLRWLGLEWPTRKEVQDRAKEARIREMGIYIVDPAPIWACNTGESDEEVDSNSVRGENADEIQDIDMDEEYTIYKTRNRHQNRSSGGGRTRKLH
ncbi:hypothetical protein BGX27_001444 [Mortierella sp. AM989]|nr:hypothetical protein BGX27_001444 [Mortierella sp. AM989]